MSEQLREAIETWKQASNEAREAENVLTLESERFQSLGGTPPDPKLVVEVARLRARADRALADAVTAMDAARKRG
jgi:hypothetical protein